MLLEKDVMSGNEVKCALCGETVDTYVVGLHPSGNHYTLCHRCSQVDEGMDFVDYGNQNLIDTLISSGYIECNTCGNKYDYTVVSLENNVLKVKCKECGEAFEIGIALEDVREFFEEKKDQNQIERSLLEEEANNEEDEEIDEARYSFDYKPTSRANESNTVFTFSTGRPQEPIDLDEISDDDEDTVFFD